MRSGADLRPSARSDPARCTLATWSRAASWIARRHKGPVGARGREGREGPDRSMVDRGPRVPASTSPRRDRREAASCMVMLARRHHIPEGPGLGWCAASLSTPMASIAEVLRSLCSPAMAGSTSSTIGATAASRGRERGGGCSRERRTMPIGGGPRAHGAGWLRRGSAARLLPGCPGHPGLGSRRGVERRAISSSRGPVDRKFSAIRRPWRGADSRR